MSYTTKVITDTTSDFSNDPQTISENGQPASVVVDNLTANTHYYTKAEIWQNGVYQNVSNIEQFQTLQAGTITLTHQSTERSGSNYVIKFTYTSTYALSSATIKCGTAISAQGTIAGNTITFTFPATNLVDGHTYICTVNAIDIYTEQASVNYGFTHHKLYQLAISGTNSTDTTVECELDYIIDGTFTEGYVEWWNAGDDPSTDQPQGHEYFVDGADTCTISGLTDGTTYKFRATIFYDGYVENTVSNVATATTVVDYDSKYFTITNTGSDSLTVTLIKSNVGQVSDYQPVYVSKNGTSWTAYNPSTEGTSLGTLNVGKKMMLKHTGAMSPLGRIRLGITSNYSTTKIELSGNIASLCFGDNFTGTKTMPDYAYANLFTRINNTITQIDTRNLSFASYTSISNFGMQQMFYESNIVYPPDLSCIIEVGNSGMYETFYGCTLLTTAPKLNNVRSVGNGGFGHTFYGCTSLRTSPKLNNVTTVGGSGMLGMFYGCSRLTIVYAPTITWDTSKTKNWLFNVAASGTVYADSSIINTIPDNEVSGCPSGWTKQLMS